MNYKTIKHNGNTLSYIDEGKGYPIIISHGTPTNSQEYQKLINIMKGKYRIIAIDHLGFGRSDKPGRKISLEEHSDNFQKLINTIDVERFSVIGHDFGGSIAINALNRIENSSDKIFLMNTWFFDLLQFKEIEKVAKYIDSWLVKFLYINMNFSAGVLLKKAISDKSAFSKDKLKSYSDQFPDKNSRWGTYSFALDLVKRQDFFKRAGETLSKLNSENIEIVWGIKDELLGKNIPNYIRKNFNFKFHELDAGHFVAEERPEQLADIIINSPGK